MRVLAACEFSGVVRDAFAARGHRAWSVDLLPTERIGMHHQGDVRHVLEKWIPFDLIIAFPPCTHLASSGARWFKSKQKEQAEAIEFARWLIDYEGCDRVCVENPVGVLSTKVRKPDQIIQPWMFGHGETKATCLWLKGLPKLVPTNIVSDRFHRIHMMPGNKNQARNRSRTYTGIADAMADQWGVL